MASKNFNIKELHAIREQWEDILPEIIPEKYRDIYKARKKAVDMYIEGYKIAEIEKTTGIYASKLSGYIKKCITIKADGHYYGYQGLIPYMRTENLDTNKSTKGPFLRLLNKFPSLKDFIIGNYFGDRKYTLEKNMNIKTLHQKFLKECLNVGVQQHEYPFNTINRGYVSLSKYVKTLQLENTNKQAQRESKDNMQKLYSTGVGKRYSRDAVAPFSDVQIDGHIIDLEYTVEIYNIDNTVSKVIATRAWLFAVIDVATRCILGFSVSQEFNYNQYDVMDAIKDAIEPRKKIEFTIPGLKYPENGGYYSLAFPELKYVLFDNVKLDNAKAHLAGYTVEKLTEDLKCAISFGSVATPETRGIIERFFGSLETRGFHTLPMTTGSNIADLKRRQPEKAAIKYDVTYDQIVELLEVLIANYNNTPHSGIENLTPLESMRKKIYEAGLMPTLADDDMINIIEKLNLRVTTRKVIGRTQNGKRPYINFEGTEYRSKELSLTGIYIGQTITILFNPRDISTVEAYTAEGIYIGTLTAKGEFGTKSHSLKTRKNAKKLARKRGREKLEFDTPISAYSQYLLDNGHKSRRDATKADIVRREQHAPTFSEIEKKDNKNSIVELEQKVDSGQELKYEEVKDLSPEELYNVMFGTRRG